MINEDDPELVARRDALIKKYRKQAKKKKKKKSVGDKLNDKRQGLSAVMSELRKQNGQ